MSGSREGPRAAHGGQGACVSHDKCVFLSPSSSVVHVPGVNDIQSSSSTGQNMSQISRQLNQGQVAWTGSRPPFPGQVWASVRALPPGNKREQSTLDVALRAGQCPGLELTSPITAGRPGAPATPRAL